MKLHAILVMFLLALPVAGIAQDNGWSFDPGALVAGSSDLLRRAPDAQIDGLFQAVHAASQDPREAQAICTLFQPDADRSLEGLNAMASQLRPASRQRFVKALADTLVSAMQSPPQWYDAARAQHALKAAGVTAALLHDGFVGGLTASGNDPNNRDARCHSLRWLLDAMQSRPVSERAGMTRFLLDQGLTRLAAAP